jgi:16S rRNA (cytidine1402-2'-O)-methyltransferase
MGNLYIVATPIGNLQDITFRAIDTLSKVDIAICEDTRKTGVLFKTIRERFNVDISKPKLLPYFEHNELQKIPYVITLLKQGLNIALVSEAGTPTISDPGFKLVRECLNQGIRVESIPGAFAGTSALVSSGLPTDKFTYLGFLPKKKGNRDKMLNNVLSSSKFLKSTYILFCAPHSLEKTLEELKEKFGDISVVLAKELTKIFESVRKDHVSNFLFEFKAKKPKGEYVILFNLESD